MHGTELTSSVGTALAGGLMIGAAACLLLLLCGRIAGISGMLRHVLMAERGATLWRVLFLAGLVAGACAAYRILGVPSPHRVMPSWPLLACAGFLVGIGTALANGCTSGHGVCGLGLLSMRSLIAVVTFLLVGVLTATLVGGAT